VQNLTLPDLGRLLESCRAFVGHDSGISHLAAAVGLPGVLLWGPSNQDVWRPPSPKMMLLRSQGALAALQMSEVMEAMRKLME